MSVLVVEVDGFLRSTLEVCLKLYLDELEVQTAQDACEARELIHDHDFDTLIIDTHSVERDELIKLTDDYYLTKKIIILSTWHKVDDVRHHHFLTKPFDPEELCQLLR